MKVDEYRLTLDHFILTEDGKIKDVGERRSYSYFAVDTDYMRDGIAKLFDQFKAQILEDKI